MRYLVTTRKRNNPVNLFDEFDNYFDQFFKAYDGGNSSFAVDVTKDEGNYSLTADLPGFTDDEIEIQIDRNLLTISAAHQKSEEKDVTEKDSKEVSYLIQERSKRSYKRSFTLPEDADTEGVSAEVSNGQLHLVIPRAEKEKPRMIKVKSA